MEVNLISNSIPNRVFAITSTSPENFQIEYEKIYEKKDIERYHIDHLIQSSSQSTAASSWQQSSTSPTTTTNNNIVPTIPPIENLYKEYKLRHDIDEVNRQRSLISYKHNQNNVEGDHSDVVLTTTHSSEGLTSSALLSACSLVEQAITEINLLIELTSSIQNNRHLTTWTSVQQDIQYPALELPLWQRIHMVKDFYKKGKTRLQNGWKNLHEMVDRRQSYADQLSHLAQQWRLVPRSRGLEGVAVDCSATPLQPLHISLAFSSSSEGKNELSLLTAAASSSSSSSSSSSYQTLKLSISHQRRPKQSIVEVTLWQLFLLLPKSTEAKASSVEQSENLNKLSQSCSRLKHDSLVRQLLNEIMADCSALTKRVCPLPQEETEDQLTSGDSRLAPSVETWWEGSGYPSPTEELLESSASHCVMTLTHSLQLSLELVSIDDLEGSSEMKQVSSTTLQSALPLAAIETYRAFLNRVLEKVRNAETTATISATARKRVKSPNQSLLQVLLSTTQKEIACQTIEKALEDPTSQYRILKVAGPIWTLSFDRLLLTVVPDVENGALALLTEQVDGTIRTTTLYSFDQIQTAVTSSLMSYRALIAVQTSLSPVGSNKLVFNKVTGSGAISIEVKSPGTTTNNVIAMALPEHIERHSARLLVYPAEGVSMSKVQLYLKVREERVKLVSGATNGGKQLTVGWAEARIGDQGRDDLEQSTMHCPIPELICSLLIEDVEVNYALRALGRFTERGSNVK